ncbi:MAG: glucoamylase family protein [Gemmatimonadaceae bacterium]
MTPSDSDKLLDTVQKETFEYFVKETNPANGLVRDRTTGDAPASIAATGLALASYPIGVERGFMTRADAVQRTLTCLRFFHTSQQGTQNDATGNKGFYYHFLDMNTGRRVWKCELSSVDSAFLIAGMLLAAEYFTSDTQDETEIRTLADALYTRIDWQWMLNRGPTVSHGWRPKRGFIPYRWDGYDEALLLYILGLGSPSHPLPPETYTAWASSYLWKEIYGIEYVFSGPLFTHQLSHIWVDFRGIKDAYMRGKDSDYFENSRRATQVQQQYAIRNVLEFEGYGEHCWGLTACDGPGPAKRKVKGIERRFFDYVSRGVPFGPDDGTIAPWAVVASLPFAPEIVLPTIEQMANLRLMDKNPYGFKTSFNQTYPEKNAGFDGWISAGHCGINQGPIVMMIENYRTQFIWNLMRKCKYVTTGLKRAGFTGGWL